MEKITLIGEFGTDGNGVSKLNYLLLNNLRLYSDLNIGFLNQKQIYTRIPNIPLKRTIAIKLSQKLIKSIPNAHILSPFLIRNNDGKKRIVTVHDFYPFEAHASFKTRLLHRIWYSKESMSIPNYEKIIVISESTKEKLKHIFPKIQEEKIEVIYPIVEPKKQKSPKNSNVIGYINNFNWNKTEKLLEFINVFKTVKDATLRLHIYGNGFPFQNEIKSDKRIKYFGFLPESVFEDTLSSFDAYLSTSVIEGFGMPIMEAKSAKVPVICYDGDIPDITKRNTLIWNSANIHDILDRRLWESFSTNKAYNDSRLCLPKIIVKKHEICYKETFLS